MSACVRVRSQVAQWQFLCPSKFLFSFGTSLNVPLCTEVHSWLLDGFFTNLELAATELKKKPAQ